MAHFYLCWELGAGLGHAARLRSIALPLTARGHRVTYVLRDLVQPRRLLRDNGIEVLQAPVWLHRTAGLPQVQASLAEILLAVGYLDAEALAGLCAGWRGLFRQGRPDFVIADYAPTAMLAARSMGIRSAAIGTGFQVPPAAQPLPAFYPGLPEQRLRSTEARVLDSVNRVLALHGATPLAHACELLRGDEALLCGWPQLDHYGRPGDGPWLGPSLAPAVPGEVVWPQAEGPRVFAYLKAEGAGVRDVLAALVRRGCRVLCYLPEVASGAPAPLDSPLLRFASTPVPLPAALAECELVVCHAGEATTAQSLLAGRPLLLLPMATESLLMARQVERIGAGINALAAPGPCDWDGVVGALLDTPAYRDAARAFARRHAGFDGARQAEALADRFEAMLSA
ncbi:hypothetical protein LQ564_07945 [Massilia sp. G4R7]|uniref:UDP:flavonoid glycosyltransferase YjiC, YdhE family n=1 Tax=Massilia phyllostachyos TaxID=2898585 RepID=A0ABS8Q5A8_9BURK|nr:nucleotide disphospho-sugar-binding domain-containing protein [Massilia phyllostachyos]MCD2516247.1 hypothetical protein [Massilia phyllostachyos]